MTLDNVGIDELFLFTEGEEDELPIEGLGFQDWYTRCQYPLWGVWQ